MELTSHIWDYFVKEEEVNTSEALCKLCQKLYSYKTSITNLKKHLQSKHAHAYSNLLKTKRSSPRELEHQELHYPVAEQATPELEDPMPTQQPVLELLIPREQYSFDEAEDIKIGVQSSSPLTRTKEKSRRRTPVSSALPFQSSSGHSNFRRLSKLRTKKVNQGRNIDEVIFLKPELKWLELRREELRIREMELQTQNGWQALAKEALELIKTYVNK